MPATTTITAAAIAITRVFPPPALGIRAVETAFRTASVAWEGAARMAGSGAAAADGEAGGATDAAGSLCGGSSVVVDGTMEAPQALQKRALAASDAPQEAQLAMAAAWPCSAAMATTGSAAVTPWPQPAQKRAVSRLLRPQCVQDQSAVWAVPFPSAPPQVRQNRLPAGLSCPHLEHVIDDFPLVSPRWCACRRHGGRAERSQVCR
nr:hypothetical protein [Dyella sedimenti]